MDSGPAAIDTQTGIMPLRFPKQVGEETLLADPEYYLDTEKDTMTYFPLNPELENEAIEDAFKKGNVGTFRCFVTLLSRDQKPVVYRLKIKPKTKVYFQELKPETQEIKPTIRVSLLTEDTTDKDENVEEQKP